MAEATAPGAFTATTPATQLGASAGRPWFRTQPVDAGLLGELASSVPDPGIADGWTAFGPPGRAASVVRCETADGRLVTLLPLYLWRRQPVRILQFIGHGPSELVAPAVAPGRRPGRARRTADRVPDGDPGAVGSLHRGADPGDVVSHRPSRRDGRPAGGSPALELRGTWDDDLASLSTNLRQQIHRRERNLARSHRVRFRLHQPRWGSASRKLQSRRAFHYEFASVALERGSLGLRPLELDDRPVAVWYGIRSVGVDTCYQSARTSAWSERRSGWRCSPTASGSPPGRRLGVPLRPRRRGVQVPAGRGRTIEGGSPRSQEG